MCGPILNSNFQIPHREIEGGIRFCIKVKKGNSNALHGKSKMDGINIPFSVRVCKSATCEQSTTTRLYQVSQQKVFAFEKLQKFDH